MTRSVKAYCSATFSRNSASEEIDSAVRDLNREYEKVTEQAAAFNRWTVGYRMRIAMAVAAREPSIAVQEEQTLSTLRGGGEGTFPLEVSHAYIDDLDRRTFFLSQFMPVLEQMQRVTHASALRSLGPLLHHLDAQLVDDPRDKNFVRGLLAASRRVVQLADQARAQRSIALPLAMTVIVAYLSWVGVIFPLGRLSALSVAERQSLIAFFTVGVFSIPGVLAIEIWRVWRSARIPIRFSRSLAT